MFQFFRFVVILLACHNISVVEQYVGFRLS
jgi:hypothetical protein